MTKRQEAIGRARAVLRRLDFELAEAWDKPRSMAAINQCQDDLRHALYRVEPARKGRNGKRKGGCTVRDAIAVLSGRNFTADKDDVTPLWAACEKATAKDGGA